MNARVRKLDGSTILVLEPATAEELRLTEGDTVVLTVVGEARLSLEGPVRPRDERIRRARGIAERYREALVELAK